MEEEQRPPARGRLRLIALGALAIGALGFYIFYAAVSRDGYQLEWAWWLILIMLGVIIYSISFYFGVVRFENTLEQYIVSDKFGRKHKWIDVETETRESGDSKIDAWVAHYKFARTMFAMGLLPLIAMIYIVFFA